MSMPGNEGRLKQRIIYELVLERRPMALSPGEQGPATAAIPLPENPPTATPANSWITYDDPAGRFHFKHPQELALDQSRPTNALAVPLWDIRPSGTAAMVLILPSSRGDTENDRAFRDPAGFQKVMEAHFESVKDSVTWGTAGWLDDEDLKTLNRKVYRTEAALKGGKVERPVLCRLVPRDRPERRQELHRPELDRARRPRRLSRSDRTGYPQLPLGTSRETAPSASPAAAAAAAPGGAQPLATPGAAEARPVSREAPPGAPPVAPGTGPARFPPR